MEIYKLQQLSVTVCFIIASVLCCICFDILRAIRSTYHINKVREAIIDISFWLICSIIIYVCIYFSNSADIRWFEFLGAIIGIAVYISFLNKYSYKIILILVQISFKIICFIFKLICIPHKFLHILTMPVKNFIIKSKAAIYYVFHASCQKIFGKTKPILTKIKRKWNTNLIIIHFTIKQSYYIIFINHIVVLANFNSYCKVYLGVIIWSVVQK